MKQINIFLLLLLFLSCWNKQDHDILIPDTPVYDLSGRVICSLTNLPVTNATIRINGLVKYNEEDSVQNLLHDEFSDENGEFLFTDIPGGYTYKITILKDSYQDFNEQYVLYYEDRILENIMLGKYLKLEYEIFYEDVAITGIADKNGNLCVTDTLSDCVIELDEDMFIKSYSAAFDQVKPVGLAWDDSSFYTFNAVKNTILNFTVLIWGNIVQLATYDPLPDPFLPEQILTLTDLSCADGNIWACSPQVRMSYFQFDPTDIESISFYESPMPHPKSVAVDSTIIYLACQYSDKSRLYQIDKQTKDVLGYSVIPWYVDVNTITYANSYMWFVKDDCIQKLSF